MKNWNRFLCVVLLAAAFAACSDDDDAGKKPGAGDVVSFEAGEGLVDPAGARVVLGDIEVSGGTADGKHHRVFWAKGGNFPQAGYDGVLCSTADKKIAFGTYFMPDNGYGEYWSGFVLSGNFDKTIATFDYHDQFTSYTERGANGSSVCMIGYDGSYTDGPVYALPTVLFAEPRTVTHLYLANTAVTYNYAPSAVDPASFYYKIVVIGSLAGTETGRAECVLINGASKAKDWVRVDCSALGKVDRLEFKPASNDVNSYGLLVPAYFALDEIGYEK